MENQIPQNPPQQPVTSPPPAPRSHVLITALTGLLMLGIGLGGGYYLFASKIPVYQPTNHLAQISPTTVQAQPTTVPSPTPDPATATWKTVAFHNISLKIPTTWYNSSIDSDAQTGKNFMSINPTKLPYPSDAAPGFSINEEQNVSIEQAVEEKKAWGLSNVKQTNTTVSPDKITGVILEGTTQPGFMDAKNFRYVFFKIQQNVYYFLDLDLAENHTLYFDQIVSTITVNYKQAALGEACEGSSLMVCAKGLTCKLPEHSIASAPGICVK
ncbi:hypothetical protein BH11PAT1_BH11PAT1_0400 [soil metagenome]